MELVEARLERFSDLWCAEYTGGETEQYATMVVLRPEMGDRTDETT